MMNYYPVKEVAFVFTQEVVAAINLKLFQQVKDPLGDILVDQNKFMEMAREYELPDAFYDIAPVLDICDNIQCHKEFEGFLDTFDITLAKDKANIISERQETYICYLPLNEEPSYLKAPYGFSDEMLAEVKEKLKGSLPDDFDFGKYLCSISGVYLS